MKNMHIVPTGYVVKMYAPSGRTKHVVDIINVLWTEFKAWEVHLLEQNGLLGETIRDLTDAHVPKCTIADYLNMLDWVYIVYKDDLPVGYASICGTQLFSIYLKEGHRNKGLGKFLIYNHMEIFNHTIRLDAHTYNLDAIIAYKHMGFKVVGGMDHCATMELSVMDAVKWKK